MCPGFPNEIMKDISIPLPILEFKKPNLEKNLNIQDLVVQNLLDCLLQIVIETIPPLLFSEIFYFCHKNIGFQKFSRY